MSIYTTCKHGNSVSPIGCAICEGESERKRILEAIEKLECADIIKTTQGLECPWTPVGVALVNRFKEIVKETKPYLSEDGKSGY